MNIYTIGHSTHSEGDFLQMLRDVEIEAIADVRAFPGSRKHPQFGKDVFPEWLEAAGVEYKHFPLLGGRRGESECVGHSLNDGWRNESFHRYADYTLTDDFKAGIDELKVYARDRRIAYLCSERHPARCHRLLISNFLVAKGWTVCHIIDGNKGKTEVVSHELGKWGAMPILEDDGEIVYPVLEDEE
ncbi:DUF488 domain-containing protein [Aciduricibacillus chroicocephali]|uniref:DUF488 domain-containing protein n=2 Tax=Aciduricibacillus chroicocephali TaxID=3054939 RepID=A0ABY9KZF2_9BACI|nr:DUF488 domain-containing protein [Bacillaceae bacterium 44XB]